MLILCDLRFPGCLMNGHTGFSLRFAAFLRRPALRGGSRSPAARRAAPGGWPVLRPPPPTGRTCSRRPPGAVGRGCTPVAARGYATGVGGSATATAAGGVHGFPAALTSFIGRDGPLREVAAMLAGHRLVTVTGPGGSGKTRLAGQVARAVAGEFAD